MPAEITFTIPRNLWHSLNRYPTNAGHRSRLRRELHALVRRELLFKGLEGVILSERVTVHWLVSYPAGTTQEHGDPVNASPVTKALLDGMVHAGVLREDGPAVVVSETFHRAPNQPKRADPHQITVQLHDYIEFQEKP